MTVKKLIDLLGKYDKNMQVEFADSWSREEGYGNSMTTNASSPIKLIREFQGRLILETDELYDDD